jgi:hypothetical protein
MVPGGRAQESGRTAKDVGVAGQVQLGNDAARVGGADTHGEERLECPLQPEKRTGAKREKMTRRCPKLAVSSHGRRGPNTLGFGSLGVGIWAAKREGTL